MTRRDFLRAIALGGGVVAGELWIPGQKLISLAPVRTNHFHPAFHRQLAKVFLTRFESARVLHQTTNGMIQHTEQTVTFSRVSDPNSWTPVEPYQEGDIVQTIT